ncbi:glutathione ABC transporter permease GsiC [Virgibacillus phasianinus]|uniref:Glutathione transport system permease protein GsiC n=1 Tax=Virgibacillus phasianinus TaxID=2017483 RepID=A0A220U2E7_9BACI|nr:nickel ABC transporter permease [Virgibacillus phasianinus]ASK62328.1 glutathione ABC transporter permease GsiC [Virgibacillus phasianinus]
MVLRYISKRIIELIPILLVISILVFLFVHLIPGNPARLVAGKQATFQEVQSVAEELGLNEPIWKQYLSYMGGLFQGDLGTSLKTGRSVTDVIVSRFMPTFWLTIWSMAWSAVIGLLIGVVSATNRNKWQDFSGMFGAVSGISMPAFWLGLLLIQLFSVKLGWLPVGGNDSWQSYVLPAITLGTTVAAVIARFTRSSLMDTLKDDFVRTGRAKGLSERKVVWGHALRNAMIPIITMSGLQFGFLLGGSIVVEVVFSWPGLGSLLIDSISFRDYPVIQAELLLFALEFMLINLIVDLLYGIFNPRIRFD